MAIDLHRQFIDFVNANSLFKKDDVLLVGVSAGIDSMTLCHLLLKEDIRFHIAHVNYNLRGDESRGDEFFVRRFAQNYFIPVHVKNINEPPKGNTQQWARNIRYNFYEKIRIEQNLDYIATGHQFDDQIETFLLNFTRGSGINGLKGIAIRRNNIIRPLLFARKSIIESYAKKNNVDWREDTTNAEDKYNRNIIRHHIVPHLNQLRENDEGMRRTFELCQNLQVWIHEYFSKKLNSYQQKKNEWRIALNDFNQSTGQFELYQILNHFGFNSSQVQDIVATNHTGRKFISQSHLAVRDRTDILVRKKLRISYSEQVIEKFDSPINVVAGGKTIKFVIEDGNTIDKELNRCYFDLTEIIWPLTIRRWRSGDRFQPFGMFGKTKKVSDLLVHLKLSFFDKESTVVLVDGSDKILWVIGHRRSIHASVHESTRQCLVVEVE